MDFLDKDGKKIDTTGADEKTLGVVAAIVGGEIHRAQAGMSDAVATTVEKAVADKIAPLAEKVETIGNSKPTDPKPTEGEKTDTQKAIEAAVAPLLELVNGMKTEREQEKTSQTARQVAETFVKQHRPNLKGKEVLIDRIAAAGVTDEAGAKKVSEAFDTEMKSLLGDEEFAKLTANPEEEGAKEKPKGDEAERAAAKQALIENIKGQPGKTG